MTKYNTLERKIATRISRKKSAVFLREDFGDLGGYDQVGLALRKLIAKGAIVKIGYGLYARAERAFFAEGFVPEKPLPELAREALARLGVKTFPSTLQTAYNTGKTTQVPTGRLIGINERVSRKIGYDGAYISYERVAG